MILRLSYCYHFKLECPSQTRYSTNEQNLTIKAPPRRYVQAGQRPPLHDHRALPDPLRPQAVPLPRPALRLRGRGQGRPPLALPIRAPAQCARQLAGGQRGQQRRRGTAAAAAERGKGCCNEGLKWGGWGPRCLLRTIFFGLCCEEKRPNRRRCSSLFIFFIS